MSNPITVGTTPIVAIAKNKKRVNVRFLNVGSTNLYFARAPIIPTSVNYEFYIAGKSSSSSTEAHTSSSSNSELNEANFITNSIAQFNVVSSGANGSLAIYETVKKYVK